MSSPVSKVREAKLSLYRKHGKIHAKAVGGRFNSLRWAMVWFTQIIFYGTCWLNWAHDGQTRQAVLFDIAHEKFYLFGLVFWPQDALLLAWLLIIAATALFLVTALAGRLFCGFACPQTVYTMIFSWVEARVEGDHLARLKLDQSPWTARKLLLRTIKHGLWLLIAAWTAISFVGYFTPVRDLLAALPGWQVGPWEGFWLIFYCLFTYAMAGLAREAVCQHMCPYSRFQGVMVDAATATVSYDTSRGEPRSRNRRAGQGGDCVDCNICVEVCPTGIDIRNGQQYQCINCGLCADACDTVMARLGSPPGLIRFATEGGLSGLAKPALVPGWRQRPRVIAYAGLLLVFGTFFGLTVEQRSLLLVNVQRDRGALLRETAEGRVENAYTLNLMNLAEAPRDFAVEVTGLSGLEIVGSREFAAAAGSIRPVQLTISAPANSGLSGFQPISFKITARQDPATERIEKSSFILP